MRPTNFGSAEKFDSVSLPSLGFLSPCRLVDSPYQTLVVTFASERRCSYSGTTGVTISFNSSGSTDLGHLRKSDHTYAGTGTYRRVTLQQALMCYGSRLERQQLRPQLPSTECLG
jgi:hypothetical protein